MGKFLRCHSNTHVVYIRKSHVTGVMEDDETPGFRKVYTIGDTETFYVDEPTDWIINEIERED